MQMLQKIRKWVGGAVKELQVRLRPSSESKVVFIMGCQRSGTTLLTEIFERDLNAKVYGEFSPLCVPRTNRPFMGSNEEKYTLRWKDYDDVGAVLERVRSPLIVTKPLVESQYADKLLQYFSGSSGIWAYRSFKDVASSNIVKFGAKNGGSNNLVPIVKNADHWLSERVSASTRGIVSRFYSEDMSPYDAGAIFWYVRNLWYFELGLDTDDRVYLCRYENLVADPDGEMRAIYRHLGRSYPGDHLVSAVHGESVRKGSKISLSPEVEDLCEELQERLDAAHARKATSYYSMADIEIPRDPK